VQSQDVALRCHSNARGGVYRCWEDVQSTDLLNAEACSKITARSSSAITQEHDHDQTSLLEGKQPAQHPRVTTPDNSARRRNYRKMHPAHAQEDSLCLLELLSVPSTSAAPSSDQPKTPAQFKLQSPSPPDCVSASDAPSSPHASNTQHESDIQQAVPPIPTASARASTEELLQVTSPSPARRHVCCAVT
jgi:hypothetical protein